ncbi:MAG: hypothetical protein DI537_08765 [Stutzerimonas stutzeri]|nr:MAG: hypothetical protein DI537_08765 [Stutzerimonas stutzeri]
MANYGLIKFRDPQGRNIGLRGNVTHNPVPYSREAVVNLDGTVDGTETPQGYRFAMSFKGKDANGAPIDWRALFAQDNVTFSFLHDSERVVRVFSRAKLVGDAQVDDITGEVSGLTGVAEGYLEQAR